MPRFGKNHIHPFLLSVFKMNDTINFEDTFFVHFEWLSNQNFPFKVCNTDCIMPGFYKQFIFLKILNGLRVNYSVDIENYFSYTCYQTRNYHSTSVILIVL